MAQVIRRKANGQSIRINTAYTVNVGTNKKEEEKTPAKTSKAKEAKAKKQSAKKPADNVLSIYEHQFKRLQKRYSSVIDNNAWDNEDVLQETIIKLLSFEKKGEVIETPEHLFNMARRQCRINNAEKKRKGQSIDVESESVTKFIEFDSSISDVSMSQLLSNDETQLQTETIEYIADMMHTDLERCLFNGYFVNGSTVRELADETGLDKMKVNRTLEKIKNRIINRCKVSDIFDARYVLPDYAESMPTFPAFKPEKVCLDTGRHIDLNTYEPQSTVTHHAEKPIQNTDIECPLKTKDTYSTYEYIAYDRSYGIEYRKVSYKDNSMTGEPINHNGCLYDLDKINSRPMKKGDM